MYGKHPIWITKTKKIKSDPLKRTFRLYLNRVFQMYISLMITILIRLFIRHTSD